MPQADTQWRILMQHLVVILFSTEPSHGILQSLLSTVLIVMTTPRSLHLTSLTVTVGLSAPISSFKRPVSTSATSTSASTTTIPFTPLPTELIRIIFETAAQNHRPTAHTLLLVSRPVRRWIHPIVYGSVEIFGLSRIMSFWQIFSREQEVFTRSSSSRGREETKGGGEDRLLATSVRNLALCDDTTGDFTAVKWEHDIVEDILRMCKRVDRLALNYTRGIKPIVDGPQPRELTIRRGLRGINLNLPPFEHVTHLQCRFEQLISYALPKLATSRLTHVCFTHHVDFGSEVCTEVVKHFLAQPQLHLLIVEVTYHSWHRRVDPEVRRKLAQLETSGGAERKLFVRLSRYETVHPYDEERFFPEEDCRAEDVWNVEEDVDWRNKEWNMETITHVCIDKRRRSEPILAW